MQSSKFVVLYALAISLVAHPMTSSLAQRSAELRAEPLPAPFGRLTPFAEPKRPPHPGDWLAVHSEPGQSVAQYIGTHSRDPRLKVIYVQPLGDFTPEQRETMRLTVEYIGLYFGGLSVRMLPDQSLRSVPPRARRQNPSGGQLQILTQYVIDELLVPNRPADALALVALTPVDLYPDPGWNFVFGQASLVDRVGIWSLWRNGAPGTREYLRRSIMTAAHELTHMLGIEHCVAWECLMNGSNHQAEKDARPLSLCPHDLAKLCFALGGCDLRARLTALARFCRAHGLDVDAQRFEVEAQAT